MIKNKSYKNKKFNTNIVLLYFQELNNALY